MNKLLTQNKNNGFTLIEIIIVVAVVSILSGIGLASYNNFSEEKKLEQEISRFTDVLILARQKALAADLTPNNLCTAFSGYEIQFPNNNSYRLYFVCGAVTSLVSTYNFPSNIQFNPTPSTIRFVKLTGTVSSERNVIRKNIVNSFCYQITIRRTGLAEYSSAYSCP